MTNDSSPTPTDRHIVYIPTDHLDDAEALAIAEALTLAEVVIWTDDGRRECADEPAAPVPVYLTRTIDGRVCNLDPDDMIRALSAKAKAARAESAAEVDALLVEMGIVLDAAA